MTISNQAKSLATFLHTSAWYRSFFGTQTFHSTCTLAFYNAKLQNFFVSFLFLISEKKNICVRIWENGIRHLLFEMQIKIEFLRQFDSCKMCVQKFHFGCEIRCQKVAVSNGLCFFLSVSPRTDLDVIQSKWLRLAFFLNQEMRFAIGFIGNTPSTY